MPSEGDALVLGDCAGEFVRAIEGCPNNQQLLALTSALQPRAGSLEPAAVRNRGDDSRAHQRDCINLDADTEPRASSEQSKGVPVPRMKDRQVARSHVDFTDHLTVNAARP